MQIAIDILSDTICPWCYIGKRRLEAALSDAGSGVTAELRWHPFQLNPRMPARGISRERYVALKFGGAERARSVLRTITDAARGAGIRIALDRIERTPNTLNSHRLLVHAARAGRQNAVVERLFAAYFRDGRDIGDLEVLAEIGTAAGLDRAETERYLESAADRAQVIESDARARRSGLRGVPHFVIDRQLAVSGAQEPEVFRNVFAVLLARSAGRT